MARNKWETPDTYLGLAISILKENKNPMTLEEITEKILKLRKREHGKTPEKSIYSALLRSKEIVKKPGTGKYLLREWI